MLGEHDHHRVDARIMFGAASRRRATSRRGWAAVGCRRPSKNRGGGASWRGSARRRTVGASAGVEHGEQARNGRGRRPATSPSGSGEKRGASPSRPRNNGGSPSSGCHAQAPVLVERGGAIVPRRAGARRRGAASAAIASGRARSWSARSRPGPAKKGSGGKCVPFGQARPRRRGGRASAARPRRCWSSGCHQPSPGGGVGARDEVEVEREVGEAVGDRGDRRGRRAAASSHSGPGSAAIPPSRPLGGRRTSHTAPSRSIHQAMPWRCGRGALGLGRGKALRDCRWRRRGSRPRAGRRGSRGCAGGRWSRRGPSSPGRSRRGGRPGSARRQVRGFRSCTAATGRRCRRAGRRPARHWCRSPPRARRTRSRRWRRRCRRRGREACAVRASVAREAAARGDGAGAGDEVAGAGVIAEPGPFAEHVLVGRGGERLDRRPARR